MKSYAILAIALAAKLATPSSLPTHNLAARAIEPALCTYPTLKPAPSGSHCGAKGRISSSTTLVKQLKAPTQGSCVTSCFDNNSNASNQKACKSVAYNAATQDCRLFASAVSGLGFVAVKDSDVTFSDRTCFVAMCICPTQYTRCVDSNKASFCAATSSDPQNCGACGKSCGGGGMICREGQCQCPKNQAVCDGTCFNLSEDWRNCGKCGNRCDTANGLYCVNGTCACPSATPDSCTSSNNNNNGSSSFCTNLKADWNNCGACNRPCAGYSTCSDGKCGCTDAAKTYCAKTASSSGGCVDLLSDVGSCGACGNECDANVYPNAACEKGKCIARYICSKNGSWTLCKDPKCIAC